MSTQRSVKYLLVAACGAALAFPTASTFAQVTPKSDTTVAPEKKEGEAPTPTKPGKDTYMGVASAIEMVSSVTTSGVPIAEWQAAGKKTAVEVPMDRKIAKDGETALLLGVKVSDGVVASYAKDNQTVSRMAPTVMRMAEALGAKKEDMEEALTISKALLEGNVFTIVNKLNTLAVAVQANMEDGTAEDKALANLIAVAGYFQGLRTTAYVLSEDKNYTAERTNVFRQENTLKAIMERINALPDNLKKLPTVVTITEQVPVLSAVMAGKGKDATFSKADVLKIKDATDKVIATIK
ncbi:MAG: hypothetical protein ACAI35_15000 [Candidatus Methylacidiphilales bacterium]|nr:hypothetical protein [Candidatus Methylacidiphilales bacterium]